MVEVHLPARTPDLDRCLLSKGHRILANPPFLAAPEEPISPPPKLPRVAQTRSTGRGKGKRPGKATEVSSPEPRIVNTGLQILEARREEVSDYSFSHYYVNHGLQIFEAQTHHRAEV